MIRVLHTKEGALQLVFTGERSHLQAKMLAHAITAAWPGGAAEGCIDGQCVKVVIEAGKVAVEKAEHEAVSDR